MSEFWYSGYRPNVAIVLCNHKSQVLWARSVRHDGWQFPQGGVCSNETSHQAVYRELEEELGLKPHHVRLIASTEDWLKYDIPHHYSSNRFRPNSTRLKGQIQKWFLFKFLGEESDFCLDANIKPEFNDWKWVDYWSAVERVIEFKQDVYRVALGELERYLSLLNGTEHDETSAESKSSSSSADRSVAVS